MFRFACRCLALASLVGLLMPAGASSQPEVDWEAVEVRAVPVAPGLHMLRGRGGNIAVATGPDGTFLVDDQYAPLTPKVLAAVAALGGGSPRFVLNTHWHGDHTGGNENLGRAGALIVAHDNVRVRMSSEQFNRLFDRRTPASPAGALPVVTFSDSVVFHLNGEEIRAFHVPPAHTDSDAVVRFHRADVIHAGDLFFSDGYPFVDLDGGGSLDGVLAAIDQVLAMAGPATKIIPGHGELTDRAGLEEYHRMVTAVRVKVATLAAAGKSRDEVIAAKPSAAFDARWGGGFIAPDVFAGLVYDSLKGRPGR